MSKRKAENPRPDGEGPKKRGRKPKDSSSVPQTKKKRIPKQDLSSAFLEREEECRAELRSTMESFIVERVDDEGYCKGLLVRRDKYDLQEFDPINKSYSEDVIRAAEDLDRYGVIVLDCSELRFLDHNATPKSPIEELDQVGGFLKAVKRRLDAYDLDLSIDSLMHGKRKGSWPPGLYVGNLNGTVNRKDSHTAKNDLKESSDEESSSEEEEFVKKNRETQHVASAKWFRNDQPEIAHAKSNWNIKTTLVPVFTAFVPECYEFGYVSSIENALLTFPATLPYSLENEDSMKNNKKKRRKTIDEVAKSKLTDLKGIRPKDNLHFAPLILKTPKKSARATSSVKRSEEPVVDRSGIRGMFSCTSGDSFSTVLGFNRVFDVYLADMEVTGYVEKRTVGRSVPKKKYRLEDFLIRLNLRHKHLLLYRVTLPTKIQHTTKTKPLPGEEDYAKIVGDSHVGIFVHAISRRTLCENDYRLRALAFNSRITLNHVGSMGMCDDPKKKGRHYELPYYPPEDWTPRSAVQRNIMGLLPLRSVGDIFATIQ